MLPKTACQPALSHILSAAYTSCIAPAVQTLQSSAVACCLLDRVILRRVQLPILPAAANCTAAVAAAASVCAVPLL